MPPMYTWECKKCKTRTQVLRKFDDSDVPPEECENKECDGKEFDKKISGKINVKKSNRWGGKGMWALLLGVMYADHWTQIINLIC